MPSTIMVHFRHIFPRLRFQVFSVDRDVTATKLKLQEQLDDHHYLRRIGVEHLLHVVKQTKQQILPFVQQGCTREENLLFWSLVEAE